MYTFKILTAPPGFFTGGLGHSIDSDSDEDLYYDNDDVNGDATINGGRYPYEEESEKYYGGYMTFSEGEEQLVLPEEQSILSQESGQSDIPNDIFEGMPLYIDSINIEKPALDELIRSNFADVFGGVDVSELEGVFNTPSDNSDDVGEEGMNIVYED